jgi:hypothetical protein
LLFLPVIKSAFKLSPLRCRLVSTLTDFLQAVSAKAQLTAMVTGLVTFMMVFSKKLGGKVCNLRHKRVRLRWRCCLLFLLPSER